MRRRRLPLLAMTVGAVLLVAACGSESSGGSDGGGGAAATATAGTELRVSVRPSEGASPKQWTLTCDPADGDHPQAQKACAALDKADAPFAPVEKGAVCTEIFGGPQEATVRGTWKGERVDATFTRQNGCEIDRWDRIAPVFPVKVGP